MEGRSSRDGKVDDVDPIEEPVEHGPEDTGVAGPGKDHGDAHAQGHAKADAFSATGHVGKPPWGKVESQKSKVRG